MPPASDRGPLDEGSRPDRPSSSHTTSLTASLRQPPPPYLLNQYGAIPAYPSPYFMETIFTGIPKDGFISPVRRFFCMFVTFDLALTALLWIMSVVITGQNIPDSLRLEVIHYSIATSLFDLVMAAAARFTILISLYALLRLGHWVPVAMTTTGSCSFLITKVFYFQWNSHSSTYMFDVFIVIIAFVLPWGEAWFLDFRVIPTEERAAEFFRGPGLLDLERTPLLPHETDRPRHPPAESTVLPFYSPEASPRGSGASTPTPPLLKRAMYSSRNKGPFTLEEMEYRQTVMQLLPQAVDMVMSESGWRFQRDNHLNGDTIMSRHFKDLGTVFRATAVITRISPREILDELFYNFDEISSWNSSVTSSRILQIVDEFTDVCYQLTGDQGGGLISSRDFVLLRHWSVFRGAYVTTSRSITHPAMPPQPQCVRGENRVVCFHLAHADGGATRLQWLLHTDLKGWIPQTVVETSLSSAMLEFVSSLRKRMAAVCGPLEADSIGVPAVP